jgi:DNA-binding NtrC family response regulator
MAVVRARIRRVAPHDCSVLLEGETGTGKELVARALHRHSPRYAGPFVPVNCAAIPRELAESHLFGHEQGAFTGARGRHEGVMEQADHGTLFLDEVAELPLPQQAMLLRSLQEREIVRLGSRRAARPVKVDLRLVAASHEDLVDRCRERRFREDLLYRIRVYRIRIPPLRERDRDVLELAQHFLRVEPGPRVYLGRDAQELLLRYGWPGNVRELRAAVLAARIDARHGRIGAPEVRDHLGLAPMDEEREAEGTGDGAASPPSRSDLVLGALVEQGPLQMGELCQATSIPRSSLRRLLAQMAGTGQVVHLGDGRERRYASERRTVAGGDPASTEVRARQTIALNHLRAAGSLTRRDYVALTGVSSRTANRDLDELVERGLIRVNGKRGKAAGYLLP